MRSHPNELILFRAHVFNERLAAALDRLRRGSDRRVVVVADETRKPFKAPEGVETLALTAAAVEALGLFCPADVGWRAGTTRSISPRRCWAASISSGWSSTTSTSTSDANRTSSTGSRARGTTC